MNYIHSLPTWQPLHCTVLSRDSRREVSGDRGYQRDEKGGFSYSETGEGFAYVNVWRLFVKERGAYTVHPIRSNIQFKYIGSSACQPKMRKLDRLVFF